MTTMQMTRSKVFSYHFLYRNFPGVWGARLRRSHLPAIGPRPLEVGKNCQIASTQFGIGEGVKIGEHVRVFGRVRVGDRTEIQQYVSLWAVGSEDREIIIGNDCIIEAGASIMAQTHEHRNRAVPIRDQGERGGLIKIGNDVLVGRLAIILPCVTIADGAVVTPGSVVTKDIATYAIVQGVPAEVIGYRE